MEGVDFEAEAKEFIEHVARVYNNDDSTASDYEEECEELHVEKAPDYTEEEKTELVKQKTDLIKNWKEIGIKFELKDKKLLVYMMNWYRMVKCQRNLIQHKPESIGETITL